MRALAFEIRQVAEDRGIPYSEVYDLVGVSDASVCNWKNGKYPAHRNKAEKVRAKLAGLKAPVFMKSKVSESVSAIESDSDRVRMIASIASAEYVSPKAQLEAIRYLLSK